MLGAPPADHQRHPFPYTSEVSTPRADAVVIDGLVMRYGETIALDGLCLSVGTGSITAILGPNGAGKTTTVETCEGYRRPQSGSVRVLGLDPVSDHAPLMARIGVMLQSGGSWGTARATEMLGHVAKLHADPLDVAFLIDRLGLGSCGRTFYRRLSGGQQQRLGLAMAIVGRPELVFLDEPTAGLDPQARRATWELLDELRASGVTIVLTTHYMEEAERLADLVYVVDDGRVIASGSPAALTSSGAKNTIRFEAVPGLDTASLLTALPAGFKVTEPVPGAYLVEGSVDPQVLAAVTAWCAGHHIMPKGLSVESQTLEDVFIELTGKGLRA
jgi:ABC-2 type transport system ATP-binding protein